MTGEEMERAIEFLLNGQATLIGQVAETNKQLQTYAQTQTEFIGISTQTMTGLAEGQARLAEGQARIKDDQGRLAESQARLTKSQESLAEAQQRLSESQARTDATVDRLTAQVSVIAEAQQHTDERLNALIDIVMEGRNGKP